MKRVLVVGGGASGLMAAIAAAEHGAKVTLLEQNRQVGKKLLATGNGRCNLTNLHQDPACYRGGEPGFAEAVFREFGLPETLRLFERIGVYTRNRNGYLYPYSDQAASVAEALRMEAEHLGVKLALGNRVLELRTLGPDRKTAGTGIAAQTEGWTYEGDACILAAGSAAAPSTGSDGSSYAFAESLGHRVIRPLPALTSLKCREGFYSRLAGLRMDASVRILADGTEVASDQGEVQFTKNGISGIPVFQISRYAVRALDEGKRVEARLNLLPGFENGSETGKPLEAEERLEAFFRNRILNGGWKNGEAFFAGLFPGKMALCLLERAGIPKGKKAEAWNGEELRRLLAVIRDFRTEILAGGSLEQAQVCSGGVDTSQICPRTMESLLVPGLYFAGEAVDIDGACGGYNLQWAWSSGYTAGLHAAGGDSIDLSGKEKSCDSDQSDQSAGPSYDGRTEGAGCTGTEGFCGAHPEFSNQPEICRRQKKAGSVCLHGRCGAGRGKEADKTAS